MKALGKDVIFKTIKDGSKHTQNLLKSTTSKFKEKKVTSSISTKLISFEEPKEGMDIAAKFAGEIGVLTLLPTKFTSTRINSSIVTLYADGELKPFKLKLNWILLANLMAGKSPFKLPSFQGTAGLKTQLLYGDNVDFNLISGSSIEEVEEEGDEDTSKLGTEVAKSGISVTFGDEYSGKSKKYSLTVEKPASAEKIEGQISDVFSDIAAGKLPPVSLLATLLRFWKQGGMVGIQGALNTVQPGFYKILQHLPAFEITTKGEDITVTKLLESYRPAYMELRDSTAESTHEFVINNFIGSDDEGWDPTVLFNLVQEQLAFSVTQDLRQITAEVKKVLERKQKAIEDSSPQWDPENPVLQQEFEEFLVKFPKILEIPIYDGDDIVRPEAGRKMLLQEFARRKKVLTIQKIDEDYRREMQSKQQQEILAWLNKYPNAKPQHLAYAIDPSKD
jgi:hypothetical protein